MLLTRECDYAVRIIRALSGGGIVSVQNICTQEDISAAIAYKIARKLEQAGLIESYRGIHGGYAIKIPLDRLTLYDVLLVIDPELLITECMGHAYTCTRNTLDHTCRVHGEFSRLQNLMIQELQARPLSELLADGEVSQE